MAEAVKQNFIDKTMEDLGKAKDMFSMLDFFTDPTVTAEAFIKSGGVPERTISSLIGATQKFRPGMIEGAIAEKTAEILNSPEQIKSLVEDMSQMGDATLGKIFETLKSDMSVDIKISDALAQKGITVPDELLSGALAVLGEKTIQTVTKDDIEDVKDQIQHMGPNDTIKLLAATPSDQLKASFGGSFSDGIKKTMTEKFGTENENGEKTLSDEQIKVLDGINAEAAKVINKLPDPATPEAVTEMIGDLAQVLEDNDKLIGGAFADWHWAGAPDLADHNATILDGARNALANKMDGFIGAAEELKDYNLEDFKTMLKENPEQAVEMIQNNKATITNFMNDPKNMQIMLDMMKDNETMHAQVLETARDELMNNPFLGPILQFFGQIMEGLKPMLASLGIGGDQPAQPQEQPVQDQAEPLPPAQDPVMEMTR